MRERSTLERAGNERVQDPPSGPAGRGGPLLRGASVTASVGPGLGGLARSASARRASAAAWLILGLGALLAALLVLPGQTVVTRALDQVFQSYAGIHRVLSGQVPGGELRAATGPLALLMPAWGHRISGGYGGALPTALALGLVPMTLAAAHVLASRLRPGLAVLMAAVLLATLAAPMQPGEPVTFLSYSGLPNRVGWAAVALLLVMILAPFRDGPGLGPGPAALDAAVAAVLVLLAFYTLASFAVVAAAFLLFVLLVGPRRLWAGLALLTAVLAAAAIELAWGGTRQYLADLGTAFEAGGWLRARPDQFLGHLRLNLTDFLLVGLIAATALWRRWSLALLTFLVFCVLARIWLIGQTDPRWSVLTLFAAAAVMAEHLLRAMDRTEGHGATLINPAGVQLFFAALVLPTAVRCASAVALHGGAAIAGGGTPLPFAGLQDVRLVNLWTDQDFKGSHAYLDVVADGVTALSATGLEAPRLLVLEAPDVFSPILNLPLPRGNIGSPGPDAAARVAPSDLLADVDVVIEPLDAGGPIRDALAPELEASFARVVETEHWRLHRRSWPSEVSAVSTSAGRREGEAE